MKSNQSINQYSKLILIEHTGMNQVAWHFEDMEYLNTINIQYSEVSFAVTEWGQRKLPPLELLMDCRFGRSHYSNTQYQFNTSNHKWNVWNCMIHFQLSQFEWIVIVVDCSIQIRQQNHWNYIHQFQSIPMIHNSICGMISMCHSHNYSE